MTASARTYASLPRPASGRPVTGKIVLGAMLGFFAVVLSVNGLFVFLALDTWTGTTSRHAYVEGLAYNDRLAAARRQEALGWHLDVETVAGPDEGDRVPIVLRAHLRDARGAGIDGARLTGELRHSMAEALDTSLDFGDVGGGRYEAAVTLPRRGRWELRLEAEAADGTPVRRIARVDVR